ncbi:DJ-1/PfpI family protein [Virgibacillus dakarensis]|uniref:DJ-1/PfpI family protein n=1 Tax=Virgibacillus dakarensis TaxID=1917889 RepID=UPI00135653E0|nr:DJ-1/PfpI family protein [Virgibacillus dakarensis]
MSRQLKIEHYQHFLLLVIINATLVELDILIIPGGPLRAVQSVVKNQKIQDWIIKHSSIEYICSICTGAFILGKTGLLDGKKATTHHLALKILQKKHPDIRVVSDSKVVHDSRVSSGINMTLYLVEQIMGKSIAKRTAKNIEFVH